MSADEWRSGAADESPGEAGVDAADDAFDDAAARLFAGPGEMRARCRALDWAATPLGPVARWPASLRTAARMVLAHPLPHLLLWGPELVRLYNDAERPRLGGQHPAALGRPARECRPEAWHPSAPILARVRDGESVALEDGRFTLACSPVRDDDGAVAGALVTALETAGRHRAEERVAASEARFPALATAGEASDVTALLASAEQYRLIVDGARDYAILTTDLDGRIESWSRGAESVFGWTASEAVGQPVDMTFVAEDRATGVPAQEREQAGVRGVVPDVRWHRRRDDGRAFIEGITRARRDAAGRLCGFLKVGQDLTQRRALDEALAASEARVRTLVENLRDYAIFLLDAEGRVTEWTAGAERVKGYRADEVVGRHVALFYTPEDVAAGEPARHLARAAAEGRGEWEGWRVRKDGSRFWANEIATAVRDADGRTVGFTKISRDLTERRLAEQSAEQAQLTAARDELRRALVAAEETERRRLARELHDQLGQHLTALSLGLAEARRRLVAPTPDPARPDAAAPDADAPDVDARGVSGILARLEELARRMTRDARALALELRPPELDDLGLVSAVETYVHEWGTRSGVAAEVAVAGVHERELPADVASALYRILQEALTNVARHAGATQVSVIVEQPDGEVGLIVEDDGRGFDPDTTIARVRQERRLGLAGMRERAALVGGTVAIESSPGGGTTVYVRLPVLHPLNDPAPRPLQPAVVRRERPTDQPTPGNGTPGNGEGGA